MTDSSELEGLYALIAERDAVIDCLLKYEQYVLAYLAEYGKQGEYQQALTDFGERPNDFKILDEVKAKAFDEGVAAHGWRVAQELLKLLPRDIEVTNRYRKK